MNEFLNSKFVTDLKNGQLPTVEVEVATKSVVLIAGAFLLVGVILIVGNAIVKK